MTIDASARPHVLLVHGAWGGAWGWAAVTEILIERGWDVTALDLPSVAAEREPRRGLYDDAHVVRSALDAIEGPVVVLAHSYGGAPVSEGAAGAANVAHIIYLAAFQFDVGESLATAVGDAPPHWWRIDGDVVFPNNPKDIFFNDVDDDLAADAITRLLPQSLVSAQQPLTAAAWKSTPSTYVICELDNAVPPSAQEAMSARADRVIRLASGHSPFLSRPDDVAKIIEATAHR